MSGVMRKAMVYLGLSDDDYQDLPHDDHLSVSAPRAGTDYSRGTSSIRPLANERPPAPVSALPQRPITTTMPRQERSEPRVEREKEKEKEKPQKKRSEVVRVHVVEPVEFADAQQVGDKLRLDVPVCVVLSGVEAELARRLIDFCSGSTYVLNGTMERIGKNVFLLVPAGVRVSDEERKRLSERGLAHAF